MYCPNCSADNNIQQKYCRACGFNLETTSESFTEQNLSSGKNSLVRQEKMLEKFGQLAFCGFGVVFVIGIVAIIYAVMTKFIIPGPASSVILGLFIIAFLIFAAPALAYVVFREVLKEKRQKINPYAGKESTGGKDTGKLLREGYLQPVSSVIEDTTELLHDRSRTNKLG